MKPILRYSLTALALSVLSISATAAPNYVNYQGRLSDAAGQPLATGNYTLEFNIYDATTEGDLIWGPFLCDGIAGDGHAAQVSILEGHFNVILGPKDTGANDLSTAFTTNERFIEIKVNGGAPILPRQQYLSVPYAFKADSAGSATTASSATTAGSATTANSATTLTGNTWDPGLGNTASIKAGGTEIVRIARRIGSNPDSLKVNTGHIILDPNYGIFTVNGVGAKAAGMDTDLGNNLDLWAGGAPLVRLIPGRFLPTVNSGNDTTSNNSPGMFLGDAAHRWKAVYARDGSIETSDERLKDDIQDLDYGLDEILKLRATQYHWKSDPSEVPQIGLIAQELQNVIPEAVNVGDDEDQTLGVTYTDLIPVLVNAIQEQQTQIESLKEEVRTLKTDE